MNVTNPSYGSYTRFGDQLNKKIELPNINTLIPVGTEVKGLPEIGRATGVIVGYNRKDRGFYDGKTYPYIIKWCDGYQDVYSDASFTL